MRSTRQAVSSGAIAVTVALCALAPRSAQAQKVQASEKATLSQVISGTDIEMEYYRPSVRGRSPIFGGIVPWGEVWTPGANWATTLRVSKDVTLNGVTVPAGKYGLWIELVEDGPWTLVVHADTARFHTQHPTVEDGLYAIPVQRTESPDFVETLTFTIDRVRLSSAELRLTWGDVRVPIALGVDSGIELAVEAAEAEKLSGDWLYDDSPSAPSKEDVEKWTGDMSEEEMATFGPYFDALKKMERPRAVRFDRDPETGMVTMVDPGADALMAMLESPGGSAEGAAWGSVLLPRAQGTYMMGTTLAGELAEFDPEFSSLVEFEFGPDGRAVAFTLRGGDDKVVGMGRRPGA